MWPAVLRSREFAPGTGCYHNHVSPASFDGHRLCYRLPFSHCRDSGTRRQRWRFVGFDRIQCFGRYIGCLCCRIHVAALDAQLRHTFCGPVAWINDCRVADFHGFDSRSGGRHVARGCDPAPGGDHYLDGDAAHRSSPTGHAAAGSTDRRTSDGSCSQAACKHARSGAGFNACPNACSVGSAHDGPAALGGWRTTPHFVLKEIIFS